MHRRGAWALLALSILVVLLAPSGASATPAEGPSGSAFYTPPSPTPTGTAGGLVWYRPATVNLNVTLPSFKAWTVLYQSTDQHGRPDWVTGTVIVPTAKWSGQGERPVVTYAEGTQGLAQSCAPSLQMAAGTEYDGGAIIESLKKGYAVTVTDYQGYTNGAVPTYAAGKAEGQAVLDVVRAGRQVPGSGIGASAPVIVWGYSQGGQAAGWAAELQPSYAPDVKMVGLAAGGVPANLQAIGEFDNASVGTAFGLDGLIGLSAAYPEEFNLASISNAAGLEAAGKLLHECAIQSLARIPRRQQRRIHDRAQDARRNSRPNTRRSKKSSTNSSSARNRCPCPSTTTTVSRTSSCPWLRTWRCIRRGARWESADDFQLYPGDHLLTDPTAIWTVIKWIEERLAGKKAPSTCGQHSASATLPPSGAPDARDGRSDRAAARMGTERQGDRGQERHLGRSAQGLHAERRRRRHDRSLTANLSIPPINQTIWVGLMPVTVRGALTPTGTIHGTVGLTNGGVFSESASGSANELVGSVGVGIFTVPIGCKTVEPIQLPLSISEQVNALVVGGFSFSTKVTVPEFGGCGLFGPLLSATMSGPGNTIEMTAKPPPPINW